MSAHDDLLRILEHADEAWMELLFGSDLSLDEIANEILCQHAHDLAVMIRTERHNRYGTGLEEEYWPADLINPRGFDE